MEVKNCAYVTYNTKNFEHKLFGGMYGLAMMMFISTRTASKKIDKITLSLKKHQLCYNHLSANAFLHQFKKLDLWHTS